MKFGGNSSNCTLQSSKSSFSMNSNQKILCLNDLVSEGQTKFERKPSIGKSSISSLALQKGFENSLGFQPSPFKNSIGSSLSSGRKMSLGALSKSKTSSAHSRQKSDVKGRQMSDEKQKMLNTLSFIQCLQQQSTSEQGGENCDNNENFSTSQRDLSILLDQTMQNKQKDDMLTFKRLNEILEKISQQKEEITVRDRDRVRILTQNEEEENRLKQRLFEVERMIDSEQKVNEFLQERMKDSPEMRDDTVRRMFIDSERLFESLRAVDYLLRMHVGEMRFFSFEQEQKQSLGSLAKLFEEKHRLIVNIYEVQDKLESHKESKHMREEDIEGHEQRNTQLALEHEDLETFIDLLKNNQDDTQLQQQINLRNVWMCLQNEALKLQSKITLTQNVYTQLDQQSQSMQTHFDQLTSQTSQLLREKAFPNQERVRELSLREFVKSGLSRLGFETFEEIEFIYEGEKSCESVCESSREMNSNVREAYEQSMLQLLRAFQELVLSELSVYVQKYSDLTYKGEEEQDYQVKKLQIIQTLIPQYRNTSCVRAVERLMNLPSLFNRILVNGISKKDALRLLRSLIECLQIKKDQSFIESFEAHRKLSTLKLKIYDMSEHMRDLYDQKMKTLSNIDQMKNRLKEVQFQIEKQEQNTIPFFATNSHRNLNPTCQDESILFDETTGNLNQTKITYQSAYMSNNNRNPILNYNDQNYYTAPSPRYDSNSMYQQKDNLSNRSFNVMNESGINGSEYSRIKIEINSQALGKTNEEYQISFERKNQVDSIYKRMRDIRILRESNQKVISNLITQGENDSDIFQQLSDKTATLTNHLLSLNAMQSQYASKLLHIYATHFSQNLHDDDSIFKNLNISVIHNPMSSDPLMSPQLFRENLENLKKLLESLVTKQEYISLNVLTAALSFFEYRQPLTPSLRLSILQNSKKQIQTLLSNEKIQFNSMIDQFDEEYQQLLHSFNHSQSLYNQFYFQNVQSPSHAYQNSLNETNNDNQLSNPKSIQSNEGSNGFNAQRSQNKLKIHYFLLDELNKENISEYFSSPNGVCLYKMFKINQGNMIKQYVFDPLSSKKHPSHSGYGLRKLYLNLNNHSNKANHNQSDHLVFCNVKSTQVDISISMKDLTNVVIHPITLEIIKHQISGNSSVKKYLNAQFYPFALEIRQIGRIECLTDSIQSLKLIYTLLISQLSQLPSISSH